MMSPYTLLRCAPEGHADPDFTGTLADRVSDHTIEADHAQQEREPGKAAHQPGRGAVQVGRLRIVNALVHG